MLVRLLYLLFGLFAKILCKPAMMDPFDIAPGFRAITLLVAVTFLYLVLRSI